LDWPTTIEVKILPRLPNWTSRES